MAAYASHQQHPSRNEAPSWANRPRLAAIPIESAATPAPIDSKAISELIDRFAQRVATAIADQLGEQRTPEDEWFDCRHAADYLGVHRDTLRKLAAERAITAEQDGPGCKLYFRRSDLDAWRRFGGKPRHLQTTLASVA
jgi:excisionase family DNA binding protein